MLLLVVVWVVQGLQRQAALLRVRLHALLLLRLLRLLLVLLRKLLRLLFLLLLMSPAAWLAAGMPLAVLFRGRVNIFKCQPLLFLLDRVRIHDLRPVLLLLHVFLLVLLVLVLRLLHLY